MKRKRQLLLATFFCCLFSCTFADAQSPEFTRSLSVDANIVDLGNVPDPGFGFGISYARHFSNDRFTIGGRLGYADAPGQNASYYTDDQDFRSYGRKSERFTADFRVSYNFLRSSRHALRLGAGPSVWSRKDDMLLGMNVVVESLGSPNVIQVEYLREDVQEINFGGSLLGEYEYALTPSLALGVRGGFAQFNRKKTGFNPMGGISLGYRF